MNKINFQDGTKVSSAKVTIDEVDYPVTPARYTGATPLSSVVMNAMQTNIENAINQNVDNIGGEEYDNTATYEEGDIVKYQGQLYICIEAIETAEDWDSTKWSETDVLSSAGGNEVTIGTSADITSKTKIFIDESEGTDAYSEVVNSLSGNEIAKAPSVRAVNEALTPTFLENSDTVSLASGVTVNVDTCSIVAPKDGIAIVRIGASFAGTGGGYRYLNLGVISGSITPKANFQLPSNNMAIAFSTIQIVNIKAGDEIAPRVEQTSGSAMNVTCRIELAYL